jgi:hypothetical protein
LGDLQLFTTGDLDSLANMNPTDEKHSALLAAREMLRDNPPPESRHIALELRRCLEAVVYEKILAYGDRIPTKAKKTWQPPQAFKALLLFEPDADKTKVIRFARQDSLGTPATENFKTLGTDIRPSKGWLNDNYHKLGSYLHAKWPFETKEKETVESEDLIYFREVEAKLTLLVESTITSTIASVFKFTCTECEISTSLNTKALEKLNEVACLNPDCGCSFFVCKVGDAFHFKLDAHLAECTDCQDPIEIPTSKLKTGYKFVCKKCQNQYIVVEPAWSFEKFKN